LKEAKAIVLKPLITEKGSRLREKGNTYVFRVATAANRLEIKRAVEEIFNVKVKSVRTMVAHGKVKRLGAFSGRRPDWKKALVTLGEGQTIDLFEQV
jgi:large subunit ribosomal protein L23